METNRDEALIGVMVTNFQRHQLQRVLDIAHELDNGQPLMSYDLDFMEELCQEAQDSMHLVKEFPEYQNVYAQAIHLFKEITDKALKNEAH